MPLYPGKTTIQALGGDRVEWKAKFQVNGSGVLEVTAPPSNVVRIINDAVTGLPIEFSIQIDCIGEVILEGYDWGYSEPTYNPPLPPLAAPEFFVVHTSAWTASTEGTEYVCVSARSL